MPKFNLEIVNISDVGCKRPHNEDSTASDETLGILILADGMGGYAAGDVASTIAVTRTYNAIISGIQSSTILEIDKKSGLNKNSILIRGAINSANLSIYKMSQEEEQCHGMGTTIVAAIVYNDRISIANVGDSRLYRLRTEDFRQLTKDHSLVQELIDRGIFSCEEAEKNAPKNLVTRALGLKSKIEVDIVEDQIAADDIYLLCSDGLTDMVKDEEIHLTIGKYSANLALAAENLVETAKRYGGDDNITVILARILDNNNPE